MMKKELNKNIDNFLRVYSIKESTKSDNLRFEELESNIVFTAEPKLEMSVALKEKLTNKLYEAIQINSLGKLVEKSINERGATNPQLIEISGLTEDIINGIKEDALFPNSIPIKSLKKLLRWLELEFEQTEKAIRKTFKILMAEIGNNQDYRFEVKPTFRRQNNSEQISERERYSDSRASKLYRNEIALDKYIKRLGELYSD